MTWTQDFNNFRGTDDADETYSRTHSLTDTVDYTLTTQLNVTTNASMNLEGFGDLGLSISIDASEAQAHNTSETTNHDTNFPLRIPAGEGRRVTEQLINIDETARFECKVGVTGYLQWDYRGDEGPTIHVGATAEGATNHATATAEVIRLSRNVHLSITIDQIDASGAIINPNLSKRMVFSPAAARRPLGRSLVGAFSSTPMAAVRPPPRFLPYSIKFDEYDDNDPIMAHEFQEFEHHIRTQVGQQQDWWPHPHHVLGNKISGGLSYVEPPWTANLLHNRILMAYHDTDFSGRALLAFHA